MNMLLEVAESKASGVADSSLRRGVSVDAMAIYLDSMPTLPPAVHRKINAAITGYTPHNETVPVYYIDPADLITHGLEFYLRGCNRVGAPHPFQLRELKKKGKMELLKVAHVRLISLQELIEETGACRVGRLKIDVEGLDATLLFAYADFLWQHPDCHANVLSFETKLIHEGQDVAENLASEGALTAMLHLGFRRGVASDVDQNDEIMTYSAAHDARHWATRAYTTAQGYFDSNTLNDVLNGGDWGFTKSQFFEKYGSAAPNAFPCVRSVKKGDPTPLADGL